jgi:hypothetical protein
MLLSLPDVGKKVEFFIEPPVRLPESNYLAKPRVRSSDKRLGSGSPGSGRADYDAAVFQHPYPVAFLSLDWQ